VWPINSYYRDFLFPLAGRVSSVQKHCFRAIPLLVLLLSLLRIRPLVRTWYIPDPFHVQIELPACVKTLPTEAPNNASLPGGDMSNYWWQREHNKWRTRHLGFPVFKHLALSTEQNLSDRIINANCQNKPLSKLRFISCFILKHDFAPNAFYNLNCFTVTAGIFLSL
jgi:hypothetical protein